MATADFARRAFRRIRRRMRAATVALFSAALFFTVAPRGSAQDGSAGTRLQLRADLLLARIDAAHLGAGLSTDLGGFVRLEGIVAAGAARVAGKLVASARADVTGRFLLDPYRQGRWGAYGGAGVSARQDDGSRSRVYLAAFVGAELPSRGRLMPSLEFGVGGGVRVGLVLRPARTGRR